MNKENALIPIIVGIGDYLDRPNENEDGMDTLQLIQKAIFLANEDSGSNILAQTDTVDIVNVASWPYKDISASLGERLPFSPKRITHGSIGGESPLRYINQAAISIANREISVALICGGEAQRSAMKVAKTKKLPKGWVPPDLSQKQPRAEDYVSTLAAHYGLTTPTEVYPLYENSMYGFYGQTFREAQEESASLWAQMSEVAVQNEFAWIKKAMLPEEILKITENNRMIAFPYSKFQVANNSVNISSAVILTSTQKAEELGIDPKKWIYVWGGAAANEPQDFLQRNSFYQSSSMEVVLKKTLEINNLKSEDIDLIELYSCFPCVPKLAKRILDWPDGKPVSVIGGLTFAGAALNNYMTQSATGMVRKLREQGRIGLLYGNGEYVTKNHAIVLSNVPAPAPYFLQDYDLQHYADSIRLEAPQLLEFYEGEATLESYTAVYDRTGKPSYLTVVGKTLHGQRFLSDVPLWNDQAVDTLLYPIKSLSGTKGWVVRGENNKNEWHFSKKTIRQNSEQKSTVLSKSNDALICMEKIGKHIGVVTLNRPEKRNAVTEEMSNLMFNYIEQLEKDADIRVVILTSSNDKVFCAGADLSEVSKGKGEGISHPIGGFLGYVNAPRTKPWIAAVNGFALGGGLEISLASDLIICGEQTFFGLPEVKRGIFAAAGGAFRLPRVIPQKIALEMILTGDPINAQRALELGLVNKVVASDSVMEEALSIAFKIIENAPLAIQYSLGLARQSFDKTEEELWALNTAYAKNIIISEDASEGSLAFMEKRKPKWSGT